MRFDDPFDHYEVYMKYISTTLLVGFLLMGNTLACLMTSNNSNKKSAYDGHWWFSSDVDERDGFLDGASDCLTWVAHQQGFSETHYQIDSSISDYYKDHPADRGLLVIDVWQKIAAQSHSAKQQTIKPSGGGETWVNPHWYYDGTWWVQSNRSTREGFLEGYLWCMRTRVKSQNETYSQAIEYYISNIDGYIPKHPKSYNEPVANILYQFRDGPRQKQTKGR